MKLRVTRIGSDRGGEGRNDITHVELFDESHATKVRVSTDYVPLLKAIAKWGDDFEVTFTPTGTNVLDR